MDPERRGLRRVQYDSFAGSKEAHLLPMRIDYFAPSRDTI